MRRAILPIIALAANFISGAAAAQNDDVLDLGPKGILPDGAVWVGSESAYREGIGLGEKYLSEFSGTLRVTLLLQECQFDDLAHRLFARICRYHSS